MLFCQMGSLKAPGPDGLPPILFQKNWDIVGHGMCDLVKTAVCTGHLPDNINHTLIRLVPKIDNPERRILDRSVCLM